jgi:hypothetical protein
MLSTQGFGNQKGRVWLRVVRDGERVSTWGEAPNEGVGIAPHYEAEVDALVPLANTLAGDIIQVQKSSREPALFRVVSGFAGS